MSDRLDITYILTCQAGETAEEKTLGIALEQTVELPQSCLDADLQTRITGRVDELVALADGRYRARISYPLAAIGGYYV